MARTPAGVAEGGHFLWVALYIDGYGKRGRKGIYVTFLNWEASFRDSADAIFHVANLAKGDKSDDAVDKILERLATMRVPKMMYSAVRKTEVPVAATLAIMLGDSVQQVENCDHGGSSSWTNCPRCLATIHDRCDPQKNLREHSMARTEGLMAACRSQITQELKHSQAEGKRTLAEEVNLRRRHGSRSNGRFRNQLKDFGKLCMHAICKGDYEHLFDYNVFPQSVAAVFASISSKLLKNELRARLNAFDWPPGTPKVPDLLDIISKKSLHGNTMKANRNMMLACSVCLEGNAPQKS